MIRRLSSAALLLCAAACAPVTGVDPRSFVDGRGTVAMPGGRLPQLYRPQPLRASGPARGRDMAGDLHHLPGDDGL